MTEEPPGVQNQCANAPIGDFDNNSSNINGANGACQSELERASPIADELDILSLFADVLAAMVVGEAASAKILYLALTSRLLERPVSIVIKSESSSGKSFVSEQVLKFFPETAYKLLSSSSGKFLQYLDEDLRHRFLVVAEAAGLNEDLDYALRTLLSEGVLRHGTVETAGGKPKAVEIVSEGPTGALITTTKTALHPENETRFLSLGVDESEVQTRNIFRRQAERFAEGLPQKAGDKFLLEPWREFQEWLAEEGLRKVVVPYAQAIAEVFPTAHLRARRDFNVVNTLVMAHALPTPRQKGNERWLHRRNSRRLSGGERPAA